jgi:molybdopterin molybdotransferase
VRGVSEPISVAEARAAVLARVDAPLPAEPVPLDRALGRVLATDAVAREDVPAADNSAMDGFAVRAADTAGAAPGSPVRLRIAEESRAGVPAGRPLGEGEAFRISTGGVLPEGADAVIRIEEAAERDGEIAFEVAAAPGRDIRRAGEDIRSGEKVLGPGAVLGAAELGVLASLGVPEPACSRRPRLALVSTGDELLGPEEPMRPGGVRNSNAQTIPALARGAGAEVVSNERCPDDPTATREALERALEADVAVVCGGVSVGQHDHVKAAFAELGVRQEFWGVALRPGRPTWFGVRGGGPAEGGALGFGLPGNPVSAFVTFVLFVRPALRALAGADPGVDAATAALAQEVPRLERRDQAVRCGLELTDDGWIATPTGPQASHILTSMLGADALAVVEAGPEPAPAGSRVRIEVLRA